MMHREDQTTRAKTSPGRPREASAAGRGKTSEPHCRRTHLQIGHHLKAAEAANALTGIDNGDVGRRAIKEGSEEAVQACTTMRSLLLINMARGNEIWMRQTSCNRSMSFGSTYLIGEALQTEQQKPTSRTSAAIRVF